MLRQPNMWATGWYWNAKLTIFHTPDHRKLRRVSFSMQVDKAPYYPAIWWFPLFATLHDHNIQTFQMNKLMLCLQSWICLVGADGCPSVAWREAELKRCVLKAVLKVAKVPVTNGSRYIVPGSWYRDCKWLFVEVRGVTKPVQGGSAGW